MSTTSAYRLVYSTPTELLASYANTCGSATWTGDARFDVGIEDSAWLEIDGVDADDSVGELVACYNSRGFAEDSQLLTVRDERGRSRTVEIFVGGGVVVE